MLGTKLKVMQLALGKLDKLDKLDKLLQSTIRFLMQSFTAKPF